MANDRLHLSCSGCEMLAGQVLPLLGVAAPDPKPLAPGFLLEGSEGALQFSENHKSAMQRAEDETNREMDEQPFQSTFGLNKGKRPYVNYTYGELTALTVSHVLSAITAASAPGPAERVKKVCDLGCGTGGILLAARMSLGPEVKLWGGDVMGSYVRQAEKALKAFGADSTLVVGDFCDEANLGWRDSDVVMVASTMYEPVLMADITRLWAEVAQEGSWIVTLDKTVEGPGVERVAEIEGQGSWGKCRVVLHRKRAGWKGIDGRGTEGVVTKW
ncbi:hypothetical protein TeGR_g7708 [Tetraparma gracilis]|uniref:Methyltransferase domain-containing protein n=1 Tax=Tetraparma gracilis TaxID=2962635 RepID=A0ABQ6MV12_9STRA|nr:hypothetical protein TeGR_g7708 [Tetraparma gracilis]